MLKTALPAEALCRGVAMSARTLSEGGTRKFLLAMKLTVLFLTTGFLNVYARGVSQNVNFSGKNATLETVFSAVKKQTGFVFMYTRPVLKSAAPVTVDAQNVPLEEFLFTIFKSQPALKYSIRGKSIFVSPRIFAGEEKEMLATEFFLPVPVRGVVVNEDNEPLSGATVMVKSSRISAVTDADGIFSISVSVNDILVVSFVGHQTKEYKITSSILSAARNSGAGVSIVLLKSTSPLDEVQIVGYGQTSQRFSTSSSSVVKTKEINENQASASLSDMLQGRLPGLFSIKKGGTPGSGSTLFVRGLSTFNNSAPLIVVDGIPDRNIDEINPNDVQEVSVLKDAAAIAVYGARASNGVVLITTKQGKIGKPELNFSATAVNQRPTQIYKQVNSTQYASLYNEALQNENNYNPSVGLGYSAEEVQKFSDGSDPDHYPNTNWAKEVIAPSVWQNALNLSASGGNESIRYFLSGGYVKNDGLIDVENYKRYNLRSNLEANITKRLKVNLNIAGSLAKNNQEAVYGSDYVISQVYYTPAIRVNRFSNGTYAYVPEQRGNAYEQAIGNSGFWTKNTNSLVSNLSLQYDLPWIKGLKAKGNFAYDKNYMFGKRFATPFDMYSIDANNVYKKVAAYPTAPTLQEYFTQAQSVTIEGSLSYLRSFGRHNVNGLLLYTQSQYFSDNFNTKRQNFVSGALPELDLGDPSTLLSNAGSGTQGARRGYVGRIGYDYLAKYLFEFNFRYDGSDKFPPGHRYGFFPSVSAGWVISEEPFMKNADSYLDFLKLRASYGILGNDRVDPYQFLSTYALVGGATYGYGGYSFGGTSPIFYQSLQASVLPNPSFTWERGVMTNIGLDAHFAKEKFTVSIDAFKKRTKNILTPPMLQVPSVIGIGLPDFNNGVVDNTGFEISLGLHNQVGKANYFIEGNMGYNHNKVISYPESPSAPEWQKVTGKSIGFAYQQIGSNMLGYQALGLYQTKDEVDGGPTPLYATVAAGDIRYKDIDGDGMITANDRIVLGGNFFPRIQYGVRLGGSFKGFDLNILMQGAALSQGNVLTNLRGSTQMLDRWTPDHTNASYPRLWNSYRNNSQNSTYWVRNTSYMRVKNIELAYSLPAGLIRNAGFKQIRILVTGNNLLTFTKFKIYDPEAAGSTRDPLMKSYSAGIQLQF